MIPASLGCLKVIIILSLGITSSVESVDQSQQSPNEILRNVTNVLKSVEQISKFLRRVQNYLINSEISLNSQWPAVAQQDCADHYSAGERISGVYFVTPSGWETGFTVFCDMKTDGGGWTVIQRRGDYYGVPEDYFFRPWKEYKDGFGELKKEFWLGNDRIFALSTQTAYQLRVDLCDADGISAYAKYDRFWIANETHNYKLNIGGYSGTAGDALRVHNNMNFTTRDRDNDAWLSGNCAEDLKGAWWYISCHHANLNGLNLKGSYESSGNQGIEWFDWKGSKYSLSFVTIKIRPRDF